MTPRQYGRVSFSQQLAGQEPGIKFAALASLQEYFSVEHVPLSKETFWSLISKFQDATDGLHTAITEEIFSFHLSPLHRDQIESLGFRLSPISAAYGNDF